MKTTALFHLLWLCGGVIPAFARDELWVVEKHSDAVGVYAGDSGKHLATIKVGTIPHEFALSADRKFLYVTNYGVKSWNDMAQGGNSISILDVRKKKNVGEISLGEYHRPHGIELARNGHLFVTADFPPSLLEIDPVAKKVVRRIDVTQKLPHMVQLSADQTKAWTANAGSGSVTAISLTGDPMPKVINTGGVPMGFALDPAAGRLYVSTQEGNEVVVVDPARDEVVSRLRVEGGPARLALTPDRKYLITSLIRSGEMAVIETTAVHEIARTRIGAAAEGILIDAKRGIGYMSAQGDNRIVKFSLRDWSPQGTIQSLGSRPDPMLIVR